MARLARLRFVPLRSSLVNLPLSLYGPLLERGTRPQHLVVHLALPNSGRQSSVQAYLGWTGLASASSLPRAVPTAQDVIETLDIDPQFAQGLGFQEGTAVQLSLFYDLPTATSVGAEPVSADDWEILELHGSYVESTLLQQARVAALGQEINIWVMDRTRVRLRIVSLQPSPKQTGHQALLLSTDTEVAVAPKLRPRTARGNEPVHTAAGISQSSETGIPTQPSAGSESDRSQLIVRALPRRLVDVPTFCPTEAGSLAFLSPRTFAALSNPPTSPSQPSTHTENGQLTICGATIRRLLPPPDPTKLTGIAAESDALPQRAPNETGVASPGEPSGDTSASILLSWRAQVPDKHIVFAEKQPLVQAQEWDLLHVVRDSDQDINLAGSSESPALLPQRTPSLFDARLVGVDDILQKCTEFLAGKLMDQSGFAGACGAPGLLLLGPAGSGKTSVAKTVADRLQHDSRTFAHVQYVDITRLVDKPMSHTRSAFKFWYEKAAWHRPSVVILDNLDKLAGAQLEHTDSFKERQMAELYISTFGPFAHAHSADFRGVTVIATAASQSSLNAVFTSSHCFEETVKIKSPDKQARRDMLASLVKQHFQKSDGREETAGHLLNFPALATSSEGYSAVDLQDLVARAIHQAAMRRAIPGKILVEGPPQGALNMHDFSVAQAGFIPLSLRKAGLYKSETEWADIGGLQGPKSVLRETLEWPSRYGPIFKQSPLRLRSGLLLYGFPGCGKTLLASAVARECGLNFITVKGPEILNKYIGASEQSIRELFERASAAKPCVLFFDEFESIAPKRGHDSTGVTDRVVNQMLTQMDGAEGLDGVFVLAATSRPDLIDPALLRPGRLDKAVLCDMPSAQERIEILRSVSRKLHVSPDIDFALVAAGTDGYSGADLQAVIYNAHLEVIHASLTAVHAETKPSTAGPETVRYRRFGAVHGDRIGTRAEEANLQQKLAHITIHASMLEDQSDPLYTTGIAKRTLSEHDLVQTLQKTRPSVSQQERMRLEKIYTTFLGDRAGDLSTPPDPLGVGIRVSLA